MIKELIISILIPNLIGFIGNLLGSPSNFNEIVKPDFTPSKGVFPVVWITLYILMGISAYIIYKSNDVNKKDALKYYFIQLILNALFNLFFFNLKWYLFSFIWIFILLIVVIIMIYKFFKINNISAYLQVPYVLWIIFASIITYYVYLLN